MSSFRAESRPPRRLQAATLALLLIACAGPCGPAAQASSPPWPPAWQEAAGDSQTDFSPVGFAPPTASACHRLPSTREVGGESRQEDEMARRAAEPAADRHDGGRIHGKYDLAIGAKAASGAGALARDLAPAPASHSVAPRQRRPSRESVTAGMVDDNADFGEYLSYRRRNTGLNVHDRDISERYLLEVTDLQGRPIHDAEVAVQRAGVDRPVMWARTDTAGKAWVHPKAFLPPEERADGKLAVSVRKGGAQARKMLLRSQRQALQLQLDAGGAIVRPRLDLVFLVDATGSMGDEINKLKASMQAMSQQIAQLPGQPDICYGLVAYRDRGDAFVTRTHDFTDDLGAFQGVLARVQAGGGGDTPEALNEALHEVVHHLNWRTDAVRLVVLVADAPPHLDYGGPQYDRDMQAALAKGVKLFAVGTSGLDREGEYVFRQLAQYTAGRFVFLTYRDAADPGSGPGGQTVHDVKQYSVQTLDHLVIKLVAEELARLKGT